MHKDKPPGLFDFSERSIGHAVSLGLATGFLLSVVVHVTLLVWRADANQPSLPLAGAEAAQQAMAKHRPPSSQPTPEPPPAVQY